ncbi:MAG: DUF5615 family PIN-like protein [Dehalococcoidia bacterium]
MARLLLDEQMPRRLKQSLIGHSVFTVQDMRWSGLKNGALLRRAESIFDVLITMDKSIQFQQSVSGLEIGVLVLRAKSNSLQTLRPHVKLIGEVASQITPGTVFELELREH